MATAGDVLAGGAYVEITVDESKLVRGLATAGKKLEAFGARMGQIGRTMAMASAAMLAPLVVGVKKLAAFEDQMAQVATMLQGKDLEFLPGMSKGVRALSMEFGEGTSTITKGLYDILSASIPASKAMDVLRVSMMAAKAGATDTGVAADAMTTILNSYGMEAGKAGDVADWLFSVVAKGKTEFGELAPTIGRVASSAANAGLSLEELGAVISTVTRNTGRTDVAITGMNAILMTFMNGSDDAKRAAHDMGFELNTTWLKANGLGKALEILAGKTADERAEVFANQRALMALNPLLGDLAGYYGDVGVMTNRAGAAQEAFTKRTDSLQFGIDQLTQTLNDFWITVGEALRGPAAAFIEWAKGALGDLAAFVKENQGLVQVFAYVAAGLGVVAAALMALGIAMKLAGVGLAALKIAATAAALMGLNAGAVTAAAGMGLLSKAALAVGVAITGWQIGKKIAELTGLDKKIQQLAHEWNLFGGKSAEAEGQRRGAAHQEAIRASQRGKQAQAEQWGVSLDERSTLMGRAGGPEAVAKAFAESGQAGVRALLDKIKAEAGKEKADPATAKAAAAAAADGVRMVFKGASDVRDWIAKGLSTLGGAVRSRTGTADTAQAVAQAITLIGHRLPVELGLSDMKAQAYGSFSGQALAGVGPMQGIQMRQVDLLKMIVDATKTTAKNTGSAHAAVLV